MQTLSFSTLPLPILPATGAAPLGGVRTDGEGAGSPFAALLRGHEGPPASREIGDLPLSAGAGMIDAASAFLPVAAATGKILPPPGKDTANLPVPDDTLPVCEMMFEFAPFLPAASLVLLGQNEPLTTVEPATQEGVPVVGKGAAAVSLPLAPTGQAIVEQSQLASIIQAAVAAPVSPTAIATGTLFSQERGAARLTRESSGERSGASAVVARPPASALSAEILSPLRVEISGAAIQQSVAGPTSSIGPVAVSFAVPPADAGTAATLLAVSRPAQVPVAPANVAATPVPAEAVANPLTGTIDETSFEAQPPAATLSPHAEAIAAARGESSQGRGEGGGERRKSGTDLAAPIARAVTGDTPLLQPAISVSGSDRIATTAAALVAPTAPVARLDPADAVASVVDRLVAARETGVGALASVAIAHREFGDITVNFAANNNGLEVSLAAEDQDKQRALSAALHSAERTALREPAQSASQPSYYAAASAHPERGSDGQLSRDTGNRQAQGEAPGDPRRAAQPSDAAPAEASASDPGGIYV